MADRRSVGALHQQLECRPDDPPDSESAPSCGTGVTMVGFSCPGGAAGGIARGEAVDLIYRAGARGAACWVRNQHGQLRELPMTRWMGGRCTSIDDRLADEHVLACCSARPTLDLGCGPGRFTATLQQRGYAALGIDTSRAAVELTRGRGGTAVHADLFAPLPAEGNWDQVLLTDGNIGIGGDPLRTLRRAAALLTPGGRVVVDLDVAAAGVWRGMLRWETHQHVSPWFAWSHVGADALGGLAHAAGLVLSTIIDAPSRVIAVLTVPHCGGLPA